MTPCPHCGSRNTHIETTGHAFPSFGTYDDDFVDVLVCEDCGAEMALETEKEEVA